MATDKKVVITLLANYKQAQKMLEVCAQHVEKLKEEIAGLNTQTADGRRRLKQATKELEAWNSALVESVTDEERVKHALENLSHTTLKDLRRALTAAKQRLSNTFADDPNLKKRQQDVKRLQDQIDKLTGSVNRHGSAWKTTLRNLAAYGGVFALFGKGKELINSAIKKNLEYSGTLTDIRKVSGMAMEDVNELSKRLAKIDTRTSVDGLAKLAYEGAKLGMEQYGIDGMEGFVRAADQINVAIGEEMGEEALPALAKMTEVMGLIPKMGIEKALLATGSAMFKLSSTSTSTSGNIVEFAKRCTGVARTAGITTDQLLAMGSAFDAQMASPEVAATAMSKFIVAMQQNHNLIEQNLGIPDGTINSLYSAGRAMDAIILILDKMKERGNMNALKDTFGFIGGDGQRLISTMTTMAANVNMLKDSLDVSKTAFQEATAVTNEYQMQQTSAIGIMERANNLWQKAFVNPDGVDMVKGLAQAWYDASETILNSALTNEGLSVALNGLVLGLKAIATLLPVIINFLLSAGLVKGIQMMWTWGKGIALFVKGLRDAKVAQEAFNIAAMKNPYTFLATILTTAVAAIYSYAQACDAAAEAQAEVEWQANAWLDTLVDASAEEEKVKLRMNSYIKQLEDSNTPQQRRQELIREFNREFRTYIDHLGIEINTYGDMKNSLHDLTIEAKNAIYYRMRAQAIEQVNSQNSKSFASAGAEVEKQLKAFGIKGYKLADVSALLKNNSSERVWEMVSKEIVDRVKSARAKAGDTYVGNDKAGGSYSGDIIAKGKTYESTGRGPTKTTYNDVIVNARPLLSAIRWMANADKRMQQGEQTVRDTYAKYLDPNWTPGEEDPGELTNKAGDKGSSPSSHTVSHDANREARDRLKEEQDKAKAIIDNLSNFYDRQINEKITQLIAVGSDETEQDQQTRPLRAKKNVALSQARLAISGQPNSWATTKQGLRGDMIEQPDETGTNLSENLLSQILSVDIDALRKQLLSLGNSLNKPFNSVIAEVFANATKNERDNLDIEAKQQEERRKAAQQYDYTGAVQHEFYDTFNTMGYANATDEEIADPALFEKRKEGIMGMYEQARKNIADIYAIDPSSATGQGLLMTLLFGNDPDGMATRIKAVLGADAAQWLAFYMKLIQYSDNYTEAEKKAAEERKKVNDYLWKQTDTYKSLDQKEQAATQDKNVRGDYNSLGLEMGFQSRVATDPEVALYRARLEAAKEYYNFIEQHNATQTQLNEAAKSVAEQQLALAKRVTDETFAQYNALMSFVSPLNDFATTVGDAFATMIHDSKAGRKAIKTATKQMVKQFLTSSLQMISQQQVEKAKTVMHYSTLQNLQTTFGNAKVAGEVTTGTAMLAAKTDNDSAEENKELAHQRIMASMRSAGIFGWCVANLGPIAGPIAYSAMMAILMGLISFAVSAIGGSDSSTANTSVNTKIKSGMLTYDSGNVQDLKPFVGNDGQVYWAQEEAMKRSGVNLITTPTATNINGQRSLVAEQGPELVIGRETTKAMMMNNPSLLKALVNYDANYSGRRALDQGNLAAALGNINVSTTASDGVISSNTASNVALLQAVSALLTRLNQPINASINMYGTGGLYESTQKANQFMKNKNR